MLVYLIAGHVVQLSNCLCPDNKLVHEHFCLCPGVEICSINDCLCPKVEICPISPANKP